ncbi:DNA replication licensing factor MCM7 [Salpingoeca rosetta]|uniref:DNA replication licensing factor MCM7 n=1 Tax=Salpingoeca rosetta (strain ATCC 50818 / BSB-021) TaxID=946362 RepID=F2TZZ7_SALR5|nr:DNA replication licensing factor MCM7 [Salpingoeca rosetta]EGD80725.1 DNA replication licensing factor MCM7 [Salpingoeca rosetta]|eukprot:XP_004997286.1 DNA replication licensing factor MCM7 [Salpingoeca rosetta]
MSSRVPTYDQDIEKCKSFLQEFQTGAGASRHFKYGTQMQEIVNRERDVLEIDLDDVYDFGSSDLGDNILQNTKRYTSLFAEACDDLSKDIAVTNENAERTPLDTYIQHRIALLNSNQPEGAEVDPRTRYPASLLRRYEVMFKPPSTQKGRSIRQVDAKDIGSLVTVEGIVTRATAVKPLMSVATYSCDACGSEVYQEVKSPNFMPQFSCTSEVCAQNKQRGRLTLQTRGSKFIRFQEIKIQEMARHVPTGHIPRTMTVHVFGKNTRVAFPGDEVTITGIFLPVPYTGYRAIRAGLLSDTYLEAQHIDKRKKTHAEQSLTEEMRAEIEEKAGEPEIYDQLASSIAPEIYGHEDVKKALLLLLVGGADRKLADGMKIRGDINVCLMGDPGVAKSQLLKKVAELAPRGVYTTGRGSSGVGLTAAVNRDPITKELVLEGGALVLADMGVCCIDEFDKMEEGDRTAIHEVMEQQTISIAKAGITTTLNARAAILAAANPAYGRYNIKRSPTQNINLPAALLSRFDLMFLLLDRPNLDADLRLARHITYVHAHNDFPTEGREPLEVDFLRNYIAVAKTFEPYIHPDLTDHITGVYAKIREDQEESVDDTHITARTLLAILRLSTALAKLRFSNEVVQEDFEEALRLMHSSKASVLEAKETQRKRKDPIKDIYEIIKDMKHRHKTSDLRMSDVERVVSTKGYGMQPLEKCIAEYEALNVWMRTGDGHRLKFI